MREFWFPYHWKRINANPEVDKEIETLKETSYKKNVLFNVESYKIKDVEC